MALIKEICLENGITVTYHRVVSVNNITNKQSIIEIASYISKEKRNEEKEKLSSNQPMNIFIKTEYLSIPYDKNLNIIGAYTYLKGLEKFKGYIDDVDEIY